MAYYLISEIHPCLLSLDALLSLEEEEDVAGKENRPVWVSQSLNICSACMTRLL